MLSVRIPFNDVIAPFGESVDKIALTFRIKENDIDRTQCFDLQQKSKMGVNLIPI